MQFPNTEATRLTERIMLAIHEHLKPALAGHPHPYNRSYEAVHRILTECTNNESIIVADLITRLEQDYAFACEAGPLAKCVDWIRLKQLVTSPKP